ncbi:nucleotidyltransferase family protein [Acinetobacter sp. WU_MDCI_Axc73]|nr:nucleotidyltransferase family protein [Acinetobacter sp. WU_MDCI_Axc73]
MGMTTLHHISGAYEDQIQLWIFHHAEIFLRLKVLRTINAHCYLSAGVIRQFIWSELHHQKYEIEQVEIDVIFYDPDADAQQVPHIQQALHSVFPSNEWDVVNQATVHHWYFKENGETIKAYTSLFDAVSAWPETATAIAVRLTENDLLEIITPFGLTDLFELKLRWNPRLVSYETFVQRVMQKQWLQRWPKLELIESCQ